MARTAAWTSAGTEPPAIGETNAVDEATFDSLQPREHPAAGAGGPLVEDADVTGLVAEKRHGVQIEVRHHEAVPTVVTEWGRLDDRRVLGDVVAAALGALPADDAHLDHAVNVEDRTSEDVPQPSSRVGVECLGGRHDPAERSEPAPAGAQLFRQEPQWGDAAVEDVRREAQENLTQLLGWGFDGDVPPAGA
jgi:hypothetical protein